MPMLPGLFVDCLMFGIDGKWQFGVVRLCFMFGVQTFVSGCGVVTCLV
jgi:hypothetical protein